MLPKVAHFSAASLLLVAGHAVPNQLQPRTTDLALEPWVTVNDQGKPSTVTPVSSTISGTPTLISGAPHDITATVFTKTSYAKVITSTGTPLPTADSNGSGAFPICHNLDGDLAPWCLPKADVPLYVGTTYYFTWDPHYFAAPNTSVIVAGNYINQTTGETMTEAFAFQSGPTRSGWGFWTLDVSDTYLKFQGSQNITVTLLELVNGTKREIPGPRIFITKRPGPAPNSRGSLPQGAALYIALPTVIGFIVVCVAGTFMWNRHHREIQLGRSVMGRNYDVSKHRPSFFGRKKKSKAATANERINLMEREIQAEGGEVYRDSPHPANQTRRDSEALGSLAGSPTEDRRMDFPTYESQVRNPFRDEQTRQQKDKRS